MEDYLVSPRPRDLLVPVQRLGMGTEEGSEADSGSGFLGHDANLEEQLQQTSVDCELHLDCARVEVMLGRGS